MKKTILLFALVATLAACGSSTEKTTTDSIPVVDTAAVDSLTVADTLAAPSDTVFTKADELEDLGNTK